MNADRNFRWVLAAFDASCHSAKVEALGSAGGFSGAQLWRIDAPRGTLCLRRWPHEHPSPETLTFIHAVLKHVDARGMHLVPVPIAARDGATFVVESGRLWELTPFMPGKADFLVHRLPGKLAHAMKALAQFHVAAEDFPRPETPRVSSPGIASRLRRLDSFTPERLTRLAASASGDGWSDFADRARLLLDCFPRGVERVRNILTEAQSVEVRLQPCIRDIWHGHVLFQGGSVSALVDFGAMQLETVAGDVARLLGSMVDERGGGWNEGLAAYETVRPLAAVERLLAHAYDQSSVLLSGMNWLTWVYEESRHFENARGVLDRLEQNLGRLLYVLGRDESTLAAGGA